jgi:glucose-1-phosphate cytidylyltransferase
MKVVILAGGLGTRISEESHLRPKPMIEIGGMPILWHLMKIYSAHGLNEFVICCGYKGYVIKEYFSNYFLHMSDITLDMSNNSMVVHRKKVEPWKLTLVDTGDQTQTGGRLKRVKEFLGNEDFCFTYGDGLADVNIGELVSFHQAHQCAATMLAVKPPGRFGAMQFEGDRVARFLEKPAGDGGWINGGFFVLKTSVIDRIEGDAVSWEGYPLESLALDGEVRAWFHRGFWQPMDTLRDKHLLESMWASNKPPWKVWE